MNQRSKLVRWADLPAVPCIIEVSMDEKDYTRFVRRMERSGLRTNESGAGLGSSEITIRAATPQALRRALEAAARSIGFQITKFGLLPSSQPMTLAALQTLASSPEWLVGALGKEYSSQCDPKDPAFSNWFNYSPQQCVDNYELFAGAMRLPEWAVDRLDDTLAAKD